MNLLEFDGAVAAGDASVRLGDAALGMPALTEGASGGLTFGVRPEFVVLDDGAPLRGEVTATEYLGTTQIASVRTAHGAIKVRMPSSDPVRAGAHVGLRVDPRTVTLFDPAGRALRSRGNEGVLAHG
jgi:multiple sugar transport system ATP-binding protein